MARTFGRINVRIWHDQDFLTLSSDAKLVYLFLSTQGQISRAGVLAITRRKWADKIFAGDVDALKVALIELADARFVVIDERAEELLVRTYVKHDGGANSPNQRTAVIDSLANITSNSILAALIVELDRLSIEHGIEVAPPIDPSEGASVGPSQGPTEANEDAFDRTSDSPSARTPVKAPALVPALGEPEPEPEPSTGAVSISSSAEERADVESLCKLLADRIEANDVKRPTITKDWRTQARLMLDADGRSYDQVVAAITWSQDHPFWHTNILSMPKLRKQYDQLSLKAAAEARERQQQRAPKRTTDDRVRDGYGVAQRLAEQERLANRQLEGHHS